MAKRILQDVVRPHSTISRRHSVDTPARIKDKGLLFPSSSPGFAHEDVSETTVWKASRFGIWVIAGIAVLFLLFVLLSVFSGTSVEVVPLQKSVSISGDFIAVRDVSKKDNGVPFKLITLEESLDGMAAATDEKQVDRKASGTIVIYNAYNSSSQKLVQRTRFETQDGKVYRIDRSVTVPGSRVEDGELVPGSVEAVVYADIPGEEYNIGLVDFTIPGFKSDPRYSKFYARSKTPMEGGFSGTVKTASDDDIATARDGLRNALKGTSLSAARSQVPDDFILYDDAVFFSFSSDDELDETQGDAIKITENGTLYGVLFNRRDLSSYIANNTISMYDGGGVLARGLDDLQFLVKDRAQFDPKESEELSFTLFGDVLIVWDINETALARDLAGLDKDEFPTVISGYDNIQEAEAMLRPFWRNTFPENEEEIEVKKVEGQG